MASEIAKISQKRLVLQGFYEDIASYLEDIEETDNL